MSKILINKKFSDYPYHIDDNGTIIEHDPLTLEVIGPKAGSNVDVSAASTNEVQVEETKTEESPASDEAKTVESDSSETEESSETVSNKHILSQVDLDNNPDLVEQGLKVGDEVELNNESSQ